MKKILIVLTLIMCLFLGACNTQEKNVNDKENSGTQETVDDFSGTWKVEYIEYEGSKFSVNEWNNIEGDDLSDFYIILKNGGKAYIYDDEYGDLVNWLKSDNIIMIDNERCSIINGKICVDYYGDKIYLNRVSNNQEIPNLNDSDTPENNEDDSDADNVQSTDVSISNTDWRQFLKEYEEWVDKYIVIVEKYKNNPTDMSILSDYMDMVSEMVEWSEKSDDITYELENTNDAIEYSKELLKIAEKLAEVAY